MTAKLIQDRNRAVALGAAVALHGAAIALLILFPASERAPAPAERLVAVAFPEPPPPPPPPAPVPQPQAAAPAPPSRGADEAPSPPLQPRPLPSPSPAQPSLDAGAGSGSGSGTGAGSGAGPGGAGTGAGSGPVTPPQRIAGELTNADYRRAQAPAGASGTVVVAFRVRADGAADSCRVTRSSGYPAFDEATCRLIQQRFRFRPARDGAGNAIPWEIRTDYTWAPR